MNKVNNSVEKLICKVVDQISEDYEIDKEKLNESMFKILNKPKTNDRCIGLVASKGNKPRCTSRPVPNTLYCRKHTPIEDDEEDEPICPQQCKAINGNNKRCSRNAKPGLDICGLHQHQRFIRERSKANSIPCIHYDEADDGTLNYCGLQVVHEGQWFCPKHNNMQNYYTKLYKTSNLKSYIESVQDNTCVKRFDVIDDYIVKHGVGSIDTSIFRKTD